MIFAFRSAKSDLAEHVFSHRFRSQSHGERIFLAVAIHDHFDLRANIGLTDVANNIAEVFDLSAVDFDQNVADLKPCILACEG